MTSNSATSKNTEKFKDVIHLELKNHKDQQKCSIIELTYWDTNCVESFVRCEIDGHKLLSADMMSKRTFEDLGQRGELVDHSTCSEIKSLEIPMYEFVAKEDIVVHDIGIVYIPSGSTPDVGVELGLYEKKHKSRYFYSYNMRATMLPNKRLQLSWDCFDIPNRFTIFSPGLKNNSPSKHGELSRCVQLTADPDPTEKTTQYLGQFTGNGDGFDIIDPCRKGSVIFSLNESECTMIHVGCQERLVHRYYAVLPGV